ncbi:unnamed protein product [Trichogramma brassicae]|uniref:Uncharacterized protein n=1 Tax=Trichogramma brassicae TaxID=86971 RepID=A0A6H5HZI3_9HYME|nr:unnamed protein product [Trichogramma brassicae]
MIEVRDLDECATKKEIAEELGKIAGAPHLNEEVVKTLQKDVRGNASGCRMRCRMTGQPRR